MKLNLIETTLLASMHAAASPATIPLCQLAAGTSGRVCSLSGDANFCQRVREMGFGESAFVTKVSGTSTIICQVSGTRIALSHSAAASILVERLAPTGSLRR